MSDPSAVAVLRGDDHHDYEHVEIATLDDRIAIGLSRGRHPKPYVYTDPNEDVVAALATADGAVLVIADGHNGHEASDVAVAALVEDAGNGSLAGAWTPERFVALFDDVNDRVFAAVRAPDGPHPESRTTLIVAHVDAATLTFGAMGDSALYVVGGAGSARLDKPRADRFIGDAMTTHAVAAAGTFGALPLAAGHDVVLATDGFTDFVDADAALRAAYEAPSAQQAVLTCVNRAFDGGAGDNVAVAIFRPSRER